jgi:hypothetical protein
LPSGYTVGNASAKFAKRDGYTWSLFDDSMVERMMERGIEKGMGADFLPGTNLVE